MRMTAYLVFVYVAAMFAGSAPMNSGPVNTDADWLCYDDGTPAWYTWEGTYRGVWFNLEDFVPAASGGYIWQLELWFYHEESGHTWDTSDLHAELWNGDSSGPTTPITSQTITALDYAPVYAVYWGDTGQVAQHFWTVVNTEMSSGGWPSIIADGQDNTYPHSFFSDDRVTWEPYIPLSGDMVNFFMAAMWDWYTPNSLGRISWGSLKTTF